MLNRAASVEFGASPGDVLSLPDEAWIWLLALGVAACIWFGFRWFAGLKRRSLTGG